MSVITCSNGHQNPATSRFCENCGESLQGQNAGTASAGDLIPGMRLRDRYLIKNPIGQGGFGKTYLAEDTGRFNEPVVLKELTPSLQGTSAVQKAEELFQREAAMLHKLQHPQIPRFWEFFREGKRLFLVQDFIEGETYQSLLDNRQQRGQCFSETEIVELLQQLLPVLSYLHRQGIIHRDIAPDNIIRRERDGMPVLIDLGGVKQIANEVAGSQTSASATRLGKIGYAPDEQMQAGIVAPHSDLYALAVTAIVLMTGKQPQDLIDSHTMNWIWEKHLKTISPQLKGILKRMLSSQPVDRFQYAEEIQQLLDSSFNLPATQVTQSVAPNRLPTHPPNSKPIASNNSGQGGLFDSSMEVPQEILGWNWGAFLLPGFWFITNQVWIGALAWLDISIITFGLALPTMAIILGLKGNEWAWKSRRWHSIAAFKAHQRAWAVGGFIFWGIMLLLLLVVIVLLVLGIGFAAFGGMD
ncbi:protein kinase [Microcoleus sp. FACHB-68]|uniref:protein kinase domain-containing protein n=1 Tax=Microcoleus sp. FACHB-68 TaxID=2692826 RepID=UPI001686FE97|nr:protein kinase [Microcoleus sp. FACHB-68]MBD1936165.1 protein kinase [Microcoleus sp. FACHB-68]